MNSFYTEARDKLERECAGKGYDQYADAMKAAVKDALLDFCRQDEEFAQAVVQGGSFPECMKAVAKGIKDKSISDLKAYSLAAGFYFPGAEIRMQMSIDLCGSVRAGEESKRTSRKIIDLSDFL